MPINKQTMSKYFEIDSENEALFNEVLDSTTISKGLGIVVFGNNKAKQIVEVKKFNELVEKVSEGVSLAVIINEEIFNGLDDDMKKMVFDEALSSVVTNFETDVTSIEKPDFVTSTGMLKKYGDSTMIKLKTSVKALYEQREEKEKQDKIDKAAEKASKRGRKKKGYSGSNFDPNM